MRYEDGGGRETVKNTFSALAVILVGLCQLVAIFFTAVCGASALFWQSPKALGLFAVGLLLSVGLTFLIKTLRPLARN
jgi:hypothetical protein